MDLNNFMDFWDKKTKDEKYPRELLDFAELFDSGQYLVNDIHYSHYSENTRYVFTEKYPEKHKHTEIGDGFSAINLYVNVELIKIVQSVEMNICIDKDGNFKSNIPLK